MTNNRAAQKSQKNSYTYHVGIFRVLYFSQMAERSAGPLPDKVSYVRQRRRTKKATEVNVGK